MSLIIDGVPVPDTEWLVHKPSPHVQASWQSPQPPFAVSQRVRGTNDASTWACLTLDEVLRLVRNQMQDIDEEIYDEGLTYYVSSHSQSLYVWHPDEETLIEVAPYRPHELP